MSRAVSRNLSTSMLCPNVQKVCRRKRGNGGGSRNGKRLPRQRRTWSHYIWLFWVGKIRKPQKEKILLFLSISHSSDPFQHILMRRRQLSTRAQVWKRYSLTRNYMGCDTLNRQCAWRILDCLEIYRSSNSATNTANSLLICAIFIFLHHRNLYNENRQIFFL